MKCLKNTKTGNIIRVSDVQAFQMAGNTWKYVSKSEWKGSSKEDEIEGKAEVIESKPKEKKSKKVSK